MGNYFTATFQSAQALEICQRALALAITRDDSILQLDAQYRLSRAYFDRGDYQQAIPLLTTIVESLTGDLEYAFLGYSAPLALVSRFLLTWAVAVCGAFPEGLNRGEEATRLAEEVDHPWSRIFAAQALGILFAIKGDFPQARAALSAAIAFYRAMDMTFWLPQAQALLAQTRGR